MLAPAANDDMASMGVQSDHDVLSADALGELAEKITIDFSVLEGRAAHDYFLRAPRDEFCGASDSTNASSDTHFHFRAVAYLLNRARIASLAHGSVEVDDVQNWIVAEAIEKTQHIVDGEGASASTHQLHSLAILKVNTGNDHGFASAAQADGNLAFGQELFQYANRMSRGMEDRRGQGGIGASVGEDGEKIVERAGASGGDHWHGNC